MLQDVLVNPLSTALFLIFAALTWSLPKAIAQNCPAEQVNIAVEDEPTGDHAAGQSRRNPNISCRIYYAPSSLLEAGYGLFTVQDILEGEEFLRAPDGPSIPVLDTYNGDEELREHWNAVWNEFWWDRLVPDQTRFEANHVLDYQIMFGALPNHHCILDSISTGPHPRVQYDDTLVPRSSPGLGAFSYHMGRRFMAYRDVDAGEELFLNYGACDRDKGHQRYFMEHMAVTADYKHAADIVLSMWEIMKQQNDPGKMMEELKICSSTDRDSQDNHTMQSKTLKYDHIKNNYVKSLLPDSTAELCKMLGYERAIVEQNPTLYYENVMMNIANEKSIHARRSVDWILENGICAETLIPKKSTVQDGGQGGFAQHFVAKGDTVVPVPLLQIPDRTLMVIRDQEGNPTGRLQLLLNYCLAQNQSSILLCPTTNAILINHCSTRMKQCGNLGPNAEYRWASWDQRGLQWLNRSLDEVAMSSDRFLTMEVVALRDIHPGDEVFVDYGEEWEKAWEEHVVSWQPPRTPYVSPVSLNLQMEIDKRFISGDLRNETKLPYPLVARCIYWITADDDHEVWETESRVSDRESWTELSDREIMSKFGDDGSRYDVGNYQDHRDLEYWPCDILLEETRPSNENQTNTSETFVVRILPTSPHHSHMDAKWKETDLPRLLFNYPRSSIHFFVESYESDQHLLTAFRHPMGIPDEIFPQQWRNLT